MFDLIILEICDLEMHAIYGKTSYKGYFKQD